MADRAAQESKTVQFEKKAEDVVAAELRAAMQKAFTKALASYSAAAGGLDKPLNDAARKALEKALERELRAITPKTKGKLLRATKDALNLGAAQARKDIGKKVVSSPRPDKVLTREINRIDKLAKQDIEEAIQLLKERGIRNQHDLNLVLARANQAVNRVESTTRWATNRAVSSGATTVMVAAGVQKMWVPEPDACLHCLAYAGQVVDADKPFPGGLTFGDKPLSTDPVDGPPLHPNCRCRVVAWLGSEAGTPTETPEVLKREAERAVLRGKGQASEPASLRAADRLISNGTSLPKTVVQRAQRAIAAGKFST